MTLRLPDVLPYDFVDELIDSTIVFKEEEFEIDWDDHDLFPKGTRVVTPYARRLDERGIQCISNYGRALFDILDMSPGKYEEDADGYVFWPYHSGWTCTFPLPTTDEEIDKILEYELG